MTAAGPLGHHAVHIGSLLGPALVLAGWAAWSDLRARRERHQGSPLPTALAVAASFSVGAAVIHAMVVPSHFAEDHVYGAFFLLCSAAQLAWAALVVVRPSRVLLETGALANAAVLVLWAVTRTIGVPLGIAAGQREAFGVLDTGCGALELGVVVCCLLTLRPARLPVAA